MPDNFDQLINRRGTESVKWRAYPDEVLPLWVADMDFMSPEPVRRALREVVDSGVFGYPRGLHDATDVPEFGQIIIERLRDRYAWPVEPQDVIFLPGIVVGLNVMCNMFRTQGAPHWLGRHEIHIGYPQGQYLVGIGTPLDAFRAAAVDELIEVVWHDAPRFV